MNDYIIVTNEGPLRVWMGRNGWAGVPKDKPHQIGQGHKYRSYQAANRAITRMRRKYPDSARWKVAGYLTIEDARQDDNVLSLIWTE